MIVLCSYCLAPALLTDSAEVYHGRSYGPIWLCRPCQAWVGVHKGTDRPLGRLANKELRDWKIRAHAAFDPLWQGQKHTRRRWYMRLADELGIAAADCHIGQFNADQCKRVVTICGKLKDEDWGAVVREAIRRGE